VGRKYEIGRFQNGQQLLDEYNSGTRYDIIFLDILLGQNNGMDIARQLSVIDKKAVIIFLTNIIDYAPEGYEVNAFRYIIKPLSMENFETVFTQALQEASLRKARYYVINSKDIGIVKLDVDDIIYLESYGRSMLVHLEGREIGYTANISLVDEKLSAFGFIRIHKSYIVNLKYIVQISRYSISLKGGAKLPLSRNRQKTVFNAFTQYLVNNSI